MLTKTLPIQYPFPTAIAPFLPTLLTSHMSAVEVLEPLDPAPGVRTALLHALVKEEFEISQELLEVEAGEVLLEGLGFEEVTGAQVGGVGVNYPRDLCFADEAGDAEAVGVVAVEEIEEVGEGGEDEGGAEGAGNQDFFQGVQGISSHFLHINPHLTLI